MPDILSLAGPGMDVDERALAKALRKQQGSGDFLGLSTIGQVSQMGQQQSARATAGAERVGLRKAKEAQRTFTAGESEKLRGHQTEMELSRQKGREQLAGVKGNIEEHSRALDRAHDVRMAGDEFGYKQMSMQAKADIDEDIAKLKAQLAVEHSDVLHSQVLQLERIKQAYTTSERVSTQDFKRSEREATQEFKGDQFDATLAYKNVVENNKMGRFGVEMAHKEAQALVSSAQWQQTHTLAENEQVQKYDNLRSKLNIDQQTLDALAAHREKTYGMADADREQEETQFQRTFGLSQAEHEQAIYEYDKEYGLDERRLEADTLKAQMQYDVGMKKAGNMVKIPAKIQDNYVSYTTQTKAIKRIFAGFNQLSDADKASANKQISSAGIDWASPTAWEQVFKSANYTPAARDWLANGAKLESDLSKAFSGLALTKYEIAARQQWSPFAPGLPLRERLKRLADLQTGVNEHLKTIDDTYGTEWRRNGGVQVGTRQAELDDIDAELAALGQPVSALPLATGGGP